ncbi:NAD(P)/FAD-dependent oxidoreductase [Frankia sp. CiP3]|uniref:FAD-dependent oxidoreductase n=1 Tax=Frankia sp. CiP3 TaxID=2880971 RepID=UPI001EF7364C|nr:FAD-dependent oxidoreductase [Frankia sp. CiP3]
MAHGGTVRQPGQGRGTDADDLSRARPAPAAATGGERGHAVVLGAGIAGLLAARVLAESFDRVTVFERDVLVTADPRRGVPQGRHLHGLLDRGRQIMEELFPGLTAELGARGAPAIETLVGSRWYLRGLRVHPTETGLISLLASRPLLEAVIQANLRGMPGVEFVQRAVATGLVAAPHAGARIIGVRIVRAGRSAPDGLRPEPTAADGAEFVGADLVVDATGRGSRGADWLTALGLPRPLEQRVDVDLGYASRLYRRDPKDRDGQRSIIVSTMPGSRGGGAVALEGERWQITLAGMLGDHPPADPDGFEAFARTLPVPDIHDLISSAHALTDPVPHRFSGSLRRRYERLRNPPAGFLAIGDAICSFNPLYAQGMTVAAQQALVLRNCLRVAGPDLPARFYRQASCLVDAAWELATGADLRYPGVQGRRGLRGRLVGAYGERVQIAAHRDAAVARALMNWLNLVDAPTALLRPTVIAGVLRYGRAHPLQPMRVPPAAQHHPGPGST